jgi:hypothetical protein
MRLAAYPGLTGLLCDTAALKYLNNLWELDALLSIAVVANLTRRGRDDAPIRSIPVFSKRLEIARPVRVRAH